MTSTFRVATVMTALLAIGWPAAARQAPETPAPPNETVSAPATAAENTTKEEEQEKSALESWKKGRPITMQYFRPQDKRGINIFVTTKDPGVKFTGFKLDFNAAFTSQLQNLSHRNMVAPNVANGVDANQALVARHVQRQAECQTLERKSVVL